MLKFSLAPVFPKMRFNSKELLAVAGQPSHKFDKEGILCMKEKNEGLFQRNDVFQHRWCRLRGNLLFYCKSKDQYSEPVGVFVLEECNVRADENPDLPHSFSLVFQHDQCCQQLTAASESEKDSWVRALQLASFEYMRSELSALNEKLSTLRNVTDAETCKTLGNRLRSFTDVPSYDSQELEPFLELSFCCDNLMCDGDGKPPNPLIILYINTYLSAKWTKLTQTEIIEKSSNPCFFTTVTFAKGEISELTKIKISVHDVKERVTHTSTLLGESVFTLDNLLQNHHRTLRLTLISPSCASVGFVSIAAREMTNKKQRNAWFLLTEEESLWSKVERPRSYSLPNRLTSQVGIPVFGLLKTVSTNFMSQTYRFHTGLGAELHVHEIMAESKLSFSIPLMLLDLWINEEKKLMETVLELGQLSPDLQQSFLAATDCHLTMINHYTEVVDFLLKQKATSFKQSSKKTDTKFEFVPVNLHIQRMWVQNVTTRKIGVYDVITVGAFAAYSRKFRPGGLLKVLNQLKTLSPAISNNGSAILGPDPVSRAAESILRVEQLHEEIETDLQKLIHLCDTKSSNDMQPVLNSLSSKGDQLTRICSTQCVEDILSFWESLRQDSSTRTEEIEPLDLIYLNIKASIMSMASKVQSLVGKEKEDKVDENSQSSNWTSELVPSIKKLRQAIECLLKTSKLVYSIISLKESDSCLPLSQKLRHRRDIVFSHALSALVTGIMTRLWCRNPDSMFIHILKTVGILCHFEGLLSCYGDETGALEDMVVGIDDLRRVLFWLEPCQGSSNPQPRIEGSRLFLRVFIPVPPAVMNLLPAEFASCCRFSVSSVFFNIGINEQATLAEKFGDISLQNKINQDSLGLLKEYFTRFQRMARAQKGQGFHFAENYIADLVEQLQAQVLSKKSKNVEILHLSQEICKYLGGIRFTSCKSAKDRTAMSVTLEQTMVLLKDFNLDDKETTRVLNCMRSEGTRIENTLKNIGVRKYHFNNLQLMTVPKLYRPPPGTYGNVQS